jgi:hypothetical protein
MTHSSHAGRAVNHTHLRQHILLEAAASSSGCVLSTWGAGASREPSARSLLLGIMVLVLLLLPAGWRCILLCCNCSPAFKTCLCAALQSLYCGGEQGQLHCR